MSLEKDKILELLSCYIDGELDGRQSTEIERLLQHDPQVKAEYIALKRQSQLLASLPVDKAPDNLVSNVMSHIERDMLLGDYAQSINRPDGYIHLFARKVISIAAILLLAAVLSVVIWDIVGGNGSDSIRINEDFASIDNATPQEKVAVDPQDVIIVPKETVVAILPAEAEIQDNMLCRLDISTLYGYEVNNAVRQAIYNSNLLNYVNIELQGSSSVYTLQANREKIADFLSDLSLVWPYFNDTSLEVSEDVFVGSVAVNNVSSPQMMDILMCDTVNQSLYLAGAFAKLNEINNAMPNLDSLGLSDIGNIQIPSTLKPVMTSIEPSEDSIDESDDSAIINLTLTVKEN